MQLKLYLDSNEEIFTKKRGQGAFARSRTTRGSALHRKLLLAQAAKRFGRILGDVPCPPQDGRRPNFVQPVPLSPPWPN